MAEETARLIGLDPEKGGCTTQMSIAFSAWNAMAGMGMVSMPWAYQQSGLVLGILLTFLAFVLAFIAQYLYIVTAGKDLDYTLTMKKALGIPGYNFGMICFIVNLLVPVILLFQLQAQALCPVIEALIGKPED